MWRDWCPRYEAMVPLRVKRSSKISQKLKFVANRVRGDIKYEAKTASNLAEDLCILASWWLINGEINGVQKLLFRQAEKNLELIRKTHARWNIELRRRIVFAGQEPQWLIMPSTNGYDGGGGVSLLPICQHANRLLTRRTGATARWPVTTPLSTLVYLPCLHYVRLRPIHNNSAG